MKTSLLETIMACPLCGGEYIFETDNILCAKCGDSIPIIDEQPRLYELSAERKRISDRKKVEDISSWTTWKKKNYFYVKSKRDILKRKFLLDIGCGQSPFLPFFCESEVRTVNIDMSPHDTVDVVTDISKKLPFKDGVFDIVFMSNVMEHIPNPDLLMKESCRVLKTGGYLINIVPFFINLHSEPHDFFRYTHYMLEKLLVEVGFDVVEIEPIGDMIDVLDQMTGHFDAMVHYHLKGEKKEMAASLIEVRNKSYAVMKKLARSEDSLKNGFSKYPQGYGMVAVKSC